MKKMKVTLIHNPDAGGDKQADAADILGFIRGAGHSVRYQSLTETAWKNSLDEAADLVAVASGDGIVGQVAKRMIGKQIPLAILPMGTANNIANTLGLAGRPLDQLVLGWSDARRMKFDVGAASGPWGSRYFIEGLGLGLFTETMLRLDARKNVDIAHHKEAGDKIASVMEFMRIRLDSCPAIHVKLALDERNLSGEYILLEAMNIRSIGPNLCLAPEADPSDGLIDVVLVANDERERLKRYLSDRLTSKSDAAMLEVHRGHHLHIECDNSAIHIDDEVEKKNGPATQFSSAIVDVTVEPGALEFLRPA
jgi:diacylglycerol kinase (ATP)